MSTKHVPGSFNGVADALSRNKANEVMSVISQIPRIQVPGLLLRLVVSERDRIGALKLGHHCLPAHSTRGGTVYQVYESGQRRYLFFVGSSP